MRPGLCLREPDQRSLHQNLRYQSRSDDPTVAASPAPSARNVPNGKAYFMSPRRVAMSRSPTSAPANEAVISVTSVSFQPMNAPIIASIFTSPMPSPSSCRTRKYASPTAYNTPPPTMMPMSDASQPGSVTRLNANPTTMPGRVMTLG